MKVASISSVGVIALALLATLWAGGPNSLEAQNGSLQDCPSAGMWSISVWDGADGTAAADALATCGEGSVAAAYSLNAQTGAWSRWFAANPGVSDLTSLDNMQGVLALGQPPTTPEERVAFLSDRDDNWEIYVMNADGSGLTNVTNSPALDFVPVLSPDRSKVAFLRFEGCDVGTAIYVTGADGSDERRLSSPEAEDGVPVWSPDGTRIAFVSDGDLHVINMDGSGRQRLTSGAGSPDYPSWSPDGARIAIVRDGEIYAVNAYDGGQENLTRNQGIYASGPAWSPDGSKIAFTSSRDGNSEVYVMNVDGTGQTKLADGRFLAWSPDGAKMAYIMGNDLYVMDSNGSGQRNLVKDATARYGVEVDPLWSMRGTDIFFSSHREGNSEVYVTDIAGSHQVNLTNHPADDGPPLAFGCEE
jgi:Tol biopolymer transport system component